jgi:hypothetical protein
VAKFTEASATPATPLRAFSDLETHEPQDNPETRKVTVAPTSDTLHPQPTHAAKTQVSQHSFQKHEVSVRILKFSGVQLEDSIKWAK